MKSFEDGTSDRGMKVFVVCRGDIVLSVSTGSIDDAFEKAASLITFSIDELKNLGYVGKEAILQIEGRSEERSFESKYRNLVCLLRQWIQNHD